MDSNPKFDAAYKAAQSPEVLALMNIQDFEQRTSRAAELAAKGVTIDVPIMVWGWDPWKVMKQRSDYGFTWVPAALQPNVSVAPGVSTGGAVPYNPNNPPAGSIRVSIDIAFYKPYGQGTVAPPPPPVHTGLVGPHSVGNMYLTVVGDHSPAGTKFSGTKPTDSQGNFVKHTAQTPFGTNAWWEKV